jgi:hypothetical protein
MRVITVNDVRAESEGMAAPFDVLRLAIAARPGWGGRDRTSEWRNQNPLPYHLATPQLADRETSDGASHLIPAPRVYRGTQGISTGEMAKFRCNASRPEPCRNPTQDTPFVDRGEIKTAR